MLHTQEWLNLKHQDAVRHRMFSSFSSSPAILLITISQREHGKIPGISACLCVCYFSSALRGFIKILLLPCSLFLEFIEDEGAPSWHGYFYAFSMFLLACLQTLFEQRYMYVCLVLGLRLKTAVTGLVYRKVSLWPSFQLYFFLALNSSYSIAGTLFFTTSGRCY